MNNREALKKLATASEEMARAVNWGLYSIAHAKDYDRVSGAVLDIRKGERREIEKARDALNVLLVTAP